MNDVVVIDLYPPMAQCCICGKLDLARWGLPVSSETAQIVANDFKGDWGGVPACERCHEKHECGEFVGEYPRF